MPKFDDIKPGDTLPEREYVPTNISLFLYNAAIWFFNDTATTEIYTKEVEKHPAVVVDGPLQGDWLTQAVLNWLGDDGELVEFEYSNRRSGYIGDTMVSGGKVETVDPEKRQAEFSLFVKVKGGDVTAPGRAVVRFRA